MKNRPTLSRLLTAMLLAVLLAPLGAWAQYSIQGPTCVMPGSWIGPYSIVGGSFPATDQWCVSSGSTLGGTSNSCLGTQGTPSVGVTWSTVPGTATISYYHPGTATTPVATLTVTIQDPGSLNGGAQFVPIGIPWTVNITGTAVTGCAPPYFYSWQQGPNGGSFSSIPGNGQNITISGTFTTSQVVRRALSSGSMAGTGYTNTFSIIPATPFTLGVASPTLQNIASGASANTLTATASSGGTFGPTFFYQWQSSTDNVNWTNVGSSGTSSPPYSPGTLTTGSSMTTYYYRQAVTNGPLTMYTNTDIVNVYPALSPGAVSPATSFCNTNGSPGALTIAGVGGCCGSYSYIWQSSPDNSTWQAISGAPNSPSFTPVNMTVKMYFRALVTGGNSVQLPSASGVVNVLGGVPAADNQTGDPNITMNWVLSSGYDVSGTLLSQEKKFFDHSGELLQVQEKVNYRSNATTSYTHVLASQPIRDVYGRPVASTLPAPIDYADFIYAPNLVTAVDGTPYTYKNFDLFNPSGTQTDKTNSPDPVGGQGTIGTLGWYYGSNNFWEPYAPTTNYPYNRETVYRDGTGGQKKQADAGEPLIMGTNHETSQYEVPVIGEFTHYLSVRNKFFSAGLLGAMAPALIHESTLAITKDQNGFEVVKMADISGKVLMTARVGSDLTLSSNVGLTASSSTTYGAFLQGTDHLYVNPSTTAITVTVASATVYSGPASGFNVASLGSSFGGISCAQSFTYQTCPGSVCSTIMYAQQSAPITYLKILSDNTPVSITGSGTYLLYDMNTEAAISLVNGNSLNRGFYKVVATSGSLTVNYSNSFTDISYYFYNQLGQMVASISPNGVKQLITNGINAYSTVSSIPFVSLYTYDAQGRLIKTLGPDRQTTQYVYAADGKIRFSQNALQSASGAFSYTNYDQYARVVESGQYQPDGLGILFNSAAMTGILENTSSTGGLTTGTKSDVVMVVYDVPDNSHGLAQYQQDAINLGSNISTTKRYSSIVNNTPNSTNLVSQSWFNYDEEGKTVWTVQYNPALGANGYKTWDYTFDALNRMTKKVYQKTVAAETFVHYFTYDPNSGNLWKVSTNTTDNLSTAALQATYIYYLHGQLKRIELATNLQGIDYTYTLQGALKAINNNNKTADPGGDGASNGFMPDAYGTVLDYFPGDYNNTKSGIMKISGVNTTGIATESYVGNAKAVSWYSEKPSTPPGLSDAPLAYVFNYDPKYQLINSTWATNLNFGTNPAGITPTTVNRESITVPGSGAPGTPAYDPNGNILNLTRTDGSGTTTDQFAYTYPTTNNQLQGVVNTASGSAVTYATYGYDALGREISENLGSPSLNKYIQYNASGNVTKVARDAGFTQMVVQYVYDEKGSRSEKLSYNSAFQLVQITYYFGDAVYTQPVINGVNGALSLPINQIRGPGGRIGIFNGQSGIYEYELADQNGSVRAVIAVNSSSRQETIYNDYYPFGMIAQNVPGDYRYDYQGQNSEKDGETGWNSFELRMYNTRIARWLSMDPKSQFASPYEAMGNDPVTGTDKDGGGTNDYYQNARGEIFWADATDATICDGGEEWTNIGKTYPVFDGIYKLGDWVDGGKYVEYKQPVFHEDHVSTYHPTGWQQMERGGFLSNMAYSFVNSFYVTAQNLGGKQLAGRSYAFNLDGSVTTPNQNVEAFAGAGSAFIPAAEVDQALAKGAVQGEKYAFGLKNTVEDFADQIGAKHLMGDENWQGTFAKVVNDPLNELHFNLTGIDETPMNMINSPTRSGINWELNQLYQNTPAFERTTFYHNNTIFDNPYDIFGIKP